VAAPEAQPRHYWPASQNLAAGVEAHREHNQHAPAPQMTIDEALKMVNDFQREDSSTPPAKQPHYFWIFILQIGCLAIIGAGVYAAYLYLTKRGPFAELSGKALFQEMLNYKRI
jgi:hypothetical protein